MDGIGHADLLIAVDAPICCPRFHAAIGINPQTWYGQVLEHGFWDGGSNTLAVVGDQHSWGQQQAGEDRTASPPPWLIEVWPAMVS